MVKVESWDMSRLLYIPFCCLVAW